MGRVLTPLAVVCSLSLSCSVLVDLDPLRAGREDAGSSIDAATDAVSDSPSDGAADTSPVPFDGGDSGFGPAALVPGIPANIALYGVWGSSPSDYWVVGGDIGSNQGFIGHWSGGAFVNTTAAGPAPFRSVWGSANGVFIVGDKDPNTNYALADYVPQGQAIAPLAQSAPLAGRSLVSVWYEESTSTYFLQTEIANLARSLNPYASAVDISGAQIPGSAGACVAMHARYAACAAGVYGPSAAVPLTGSSGLKLRAIYVSNAAGPLLFVAGDAGYLARGSGSAWGVIPTSTTENLEGIWSNIAGETVIVGAHGTILAMLGLVANPTVVSVASPNNENLHAVTVVGAGQNRMFVAVGNNGTVITRKF